MHELSLCQAIAGIVKPYARDHHIDIVRVQVGALRQVVPESLSFCWNLIRDYEDMAEAELELELINAELHCRQCHKQSEIDCPWSLYCPHCDSNNIDVLHGNEFVVTSLEVS